jgi:hypothetical protein
VGIPRSDDDAGFVARWLLELFGLGGRSASLAAGQPGNGFSLEEPAPLQGFGVSVCGEHARYADPSRRGHAGCGSPGRTVSRVGFLGAGLVAVVGVVGGYAPRAAAAASVQLWGLDPGCDPSARCRTCSACRLHAANKLFASAADADAGRAHAFCKCQVIVLATVRRKVFGALFVDGGPRSSVDRRWQWVQAVLAQDSPVPSPPASPADPPASSDGSTAFAPASDSPPRDAPAVADSAVHAVLGRVQIRREATGRRVLYAEIHASQTVAARAVLARGARTLTRRTTSTIKGRRTIKLAIPASVGAGPSRLRVTFHNTEGHTRIVSRAVRIPSRQQQNTVGRR